MFRHSPGGLELFLAHPGGPFWETKDDGAWTIPKGQPEPGEELLATAVREFVEETGLTPHPPYIPLGSIRQKAGKTVYAWAFEGEADPTAVRSNTMRIEWPRGSGRLLTFPEIDRCGWFSAEQASRKLNAAQVEFVLRLAEHIDDMTPRLG